jgi:NitT/TauT family transport system permease protein
MSTTVGVRSSHLLQSIGVPLAVLAVWEGACRLFEISALVLPTPSSILIRLYALTSSGMIWPHFWATLVEVLTGFVLAGLVIGAMVSDASRRVRKGGSLLAAFP